MKLKNDLLKLTYTQCEQLQQIFATLATFYKALAFDIEDFIALGKIQSLVLSAVGQIFVAVNDLSTTFGLKRGFKLTKTLSVRLHIHISDKFTFLNMGQSRPLFVYFRSFQTIYRKKTEDFSGI